MIWLKNAEFALSNKLPRTHSYKTIEISKLTKIKNIHRITKFNGNPHNQE